MPALYFPQWITVRVSVYFDQGLILVSKLIRRKPLAMYLYVQQP